MSYEGADLIFPHLGIVIKHLNNHITLFGSFDIAFYGIIIGIGMLIALFVIEQDARRHHNDPNLYYDFFIAAIICGVIGARLYYVAFQWDYYKNNLPSILNIRQGGLAIYGGIIAGCLAALVFCRIRKVSFFKISDSFFLGVLVGQFIGRWGNFFNCEAFGGYTDSLFAMRIREAIVNPSMISEELLEHIIDDNGIRYIQVHPTFLYESCWNFAVFLFLYWYAGKHEPGSGNVTILYFLLYGIGRFLIEGLRTDQLKIPGTTLAVSQCLSLLLVILMLIVIIYRKMHAKTA
ncbi:MAG: prolipoprotein diacylglyceryl transferase [Lachnospiraceae bacterium]|nr:prolipoprotein diacylglyceryl transferase [Lachnospiraceae bacterium]